MHPLLLLACFLIIANFLIRLTVTLLNLSALKEELPKEFAGVWDENKYRLSQRYTRENSKLELLISFLLTCGVLLILWNNWLQPIDAYMRSFGLNEVGTAMLFFLFFFLGITLLLLPVSAYKTFSIEERYGFNRTTLATFLKDNAIGTILGLLFGGLLIFSFLTLFTHFGPHAWLICWGLFALYELFITFITPIWILPLFNRFTPIEQGSLKEAIYRYLQGQNFSLEGVFSIDGSKRSTKANAYFTGLGNTKRVALFDTLLKNYTNEEIVAILAHEVGHCKRRHIAKMIVLSLLFSGLLLFLLSRAISYLPLFHAFGLTSISLYMGVVLFLIFYNPLSWIPGIFINALSRKHEFEADAFAARTADGRSLISALKKLSSDNLSNLTPHPAKVLFSYTHPPVLDRINHLSS